MKTNLNVKKEKQSDFKEHEQQLDIVRKKNEKMFVTEQGQKKNLLLLIVHLSHLPVTIYVVVVNNFGSENLL